MYDTSQSNRAAARLAFGMARVTSWAASWSAIAMLSACSPDSATGPIDSNESAEVPGSEFCPALYMPDSDGACRVATFTAEQCSVAVPQIEDRIGQRIKGWKTFTDGLIIQFHDDTKMALWSRRIDCIDPPYAPLSNAEQSVQPDSGGIMPTAVDAGPASEEADSSEMPPVRSQPEDAVALPAHRLTPGDGARFYEVRQVNPLFLGARRPFAPLPPGGGGQHPRVEARGPATGPSRAGRPPASPTTPSAPRRACRLRGCRGSACP